MSFSEPATPCKSDNTADKWYAVSSCEDLLGGEEEKTKECTKSIHVARASSLAVKQATIEAFLEAHQDDLDEHVESLRHFARSTGGLITDEIRKAAWPVLARHLISAPSRSDADDEDAELEEMDAHAHPEWNQVQLDVHRTLARFPPNIGEEERNELQNNLTPLIIQVVSARKQWRYYQGLHDVFLTLLLVVGRELAADISRHLLRKGVFDKYLSVPFDEGVLRQLELINVIIHKVDPVLDNILRESHLSPVFALSWPLTWFSHSLHSYDQINQYVSLRSPEYSMCFWHLNRSYLFIYVLYVSCTERSKYFTQVKADSDREMPVLHQLLGNLPADLPIDSLISDALYLAKLIPSSHLQKELLADYLERSIVPARPPIAGLTRYAIQVAVVAGAFSAAAGYYFLARAASS